MVIAIATGNSKAQHVAIVLDGLRDGSHRKRRENGMEHWRHLSYEEVLRRCRDLVSCEFG